MVRPVVVFLNGSALIYYFEGAPPYRTAVLTALQTLRTEYSDARVGVVRLGEMA